MKIKVENTYSDGHSSTLHYEIDDAIIPDEAHCAVNGEHAWVYHPTTYMPEGMTLAVCRHCASERGQVLQDFLYSYTGDGSGENLDAIYEITILDGEHEGETIELGG